MNLGLCLQSSCCVCVAGGGGYAGMHRCMRVHVHVETKCQFHISFLRCCLPCLPETGSLTDTPPPPFLIWVGWSVSKP